MDGDARDCEVLVVGGGLVGLATARALLLRHDGLRVVVAEREGRVAPHQSGHNSGVIHSGLYYQPGSAKARTCVSGAARMLELCRNHDLPHRVVGKVVVATDAEQANKLDELERRGHANGVPGLARLDAAAVRDLEPAVTTAVAGLHVPHSSVVDYGAVAEWLAGDIEARGGQVRRQTVVRGATTTDSSTVTVTTSTGPLRCRGMLACGGLWADRLARACGVDPGLRIVPFRGDYHVLSPEAAGLVRGNVYPVPDPRFPFLGVHLTPLPDGNVECGPNAALALRRDGYDSRLAWSTRDAWDALSWPGTWRLFAGCWREGLAELHRSWSRAAFARAVRRLVPAIEKRHLRHGGCGIRAQALDRHGKLVDDFHVVTAPRQLHVLNAPSPAATACLEIGDELADQARTAGLLET